MFIHGARGIVAAGVLCFIVAAPAACIFSPIDYSKESPDSGSCTDALGCTVTLECRTVVCQGVTCQTVSASPDAAIAQISHDCSKRLCDGEGNVKVVPDPDDLPVNDGNPCTVEDCDDTNSPNAAAGVACPNGACDGLGHCATCDDGIRNGNETDIDCGGPNCPGCDGELCSGDPADCQSGHCVDGIWVSAV